MEIHLEKATTADAKDLASIQIEAFRSLYETYSDGQSTFLSETEDFVRWFECGHDVYKIFADAALAGGLAVMKSKTAANEYCLARIFISPELQRCGIAKSAIKLCEKLYPDAKRWYLDCPEGQDANKCCFESCGYVDTGSRRVTNDKLTLAALEKIIGGIYHVRAYQLSACLEVIHKSFATVARDFGLTRENCPKHTSFIPIEYLQNQMQWGWYMFSLSEGGRIVGYVSVSDEKNGVYELHNLAVLPECRHKGYGRLLIDHANEKVKELGGQKITLGIIEENTVLKKWYTENGFVHYGTRKFDHLPFTVGYMEWRCEQ